MKRFRVYSFLINNAYKEVPQASISNSCKCTPEYTCKLLKKLASKNIVLKNYRNSVFVTNPLMLCFQLALERELTPPLLYKAPSYKDVKEVLNNTIYSLTMTSALNVKEGKTPKVIEAYVLGKDVDIIESNFQRARKNPDLIVYPSDHFRFIKQELIEDTFLVTDADLFVDLLSCCKMNKAFKFAKDYKIFKGILL